MRTVESPLQRFDFLWDAAIASPAVLRTCPDTSPPIHVLFSRPLVHPDGSRRGGIVSLNEQIIPTGTNNLGGTTSVREIAVLFSTGNETILSSKEFEMPHDSSIGLVRLGMLEKAFEIEATKV